MEKPTAEVLAMAKENGFDEMEAIGKWNGFDAYFLWNSQATPFSLIRLPIFLLAKDGLPVRIVQPQHREHRELMALMQK